MSKGLTPSDKDAEGRQDDACNQEDSDGNPLDPNHRNPRSKREDEGGAERIANDSNSDHRVADNLLDSQRCRLSQSTNLQLDLPLCTNRSDMSR